MTREEIVNEIKCLLSELNNGEDAVSYLTQNDVKWLNENIKALEQEPKKGHWIGNYQVDFGEWQEYDVKLSDGFVTDNCHCSECGEELLSGDRGMFCPYCGTKMEEVEE